MSRRSPAHETAGGAEVAGGTKTAGGIETASRPRYSIVIPIHNEAECLAAEVEELVGALKAEAVDHEIILAENGSTDGTDAIGETLTKADGRIQMLRVPVADYGAAMKAGMLAGQGDLIVNFDIDFHDVGFMLEAGKALGSGTKDVGIVVGSKLVKGAKDERSWARHLVSWGFTMVLRLLFDRRMDDTHGMKVLRRDVVTRFAPRTIMTADLFDTELIIRARREGVVVKALPVTVEEKRKPRSSIVRRIPRTIRGLLRLRFALWKESPAAS